ncbi:MAG: hypothetical protein IMX04_02830 [Candidatus Carbobacillus altaicus]|nr:hypothetical protein [Candidatus Carbobacillus altaicus]
MNDTMQLFFAGIGYVSVFTLVVMTIRRYLQYNKVTKIEKQSANLTVSSDASSLSLKNQPLVIGSHQETVFAYFLYLIIIIAFSIANENTSRFSLIGAVAVYLNQYISFYNLRFLSNHKHVWKKYLAAYLWYLIPVFVLPLVLPDQYNAYYQVLSATEENGIANNITKNDILSLFLLLTTTFVISSVYFIRSYLRVGKIVHQWIWWIPTLLQALQLLLYILALLLLLNDLNPSLSSFQFVMTFFVNLIFIFQFIALIIANMMLPNLKGPSPMQTS